MNDTIVWIVAVAIIGFILYSRFGGSSTSSGTWMEDLKQKLSGWMPTGQTPWPWLGYGAMALSVGYVLYWAHRKLKTDLFLYKVCMRQNQEYGWDRECPGQMAAAIDQVVGGLWDNFFPVVAGLIIGGFGIWKWWGRKNGQPGTAGTPTPTPPPPVKKKDDQYGVQEIVLRGAGVGLAATIAVFMLTKLNPKLWDFLHQEVQVPLPMIIYPTLILGVWAIEVIGWLAFLAWVLIPIAVWTGFLPIQEHSLFLWEQLSLPKESIVASVPLFFLMFLLLWFGISGMSSRRTVGIAAIAAGFFVYTEFFLLTVFAWK